ncbi:hypothetical protein EI94DRAFT_1695955 [Lactarius quietus]|nr:hypothetical protein EI94DRAFT_1695955 [Lactarius quietus]
MKSAAIIWQALAPLPLLSHSDVKCTNQIKIKNLGTDIKSEVTITTLVVIIKDNVAQLDQICIAISVEGGIITLKIVFTLVPSVLSNVTSVASLVTLQRDVGVKTNSGIKEVHEEIAFGIEECGVWFDESEIGQYSGFKEHNKHDCDYVWHTYATKKIYLVNINLPAVLPLGVGNMNTAIKGQGTVHLCSTYEGKEYYVKT